MAGKDLLSTGCNSASETEGKETDPAPVDVILMAHKSISFEIQAIHFHDILVTKESCNRVSKLVEP